MPQTAVPSNLKIKTVANTNTIGLILLGLNKFSIKIPLEDEKL